MQKYKQKVFDKTKKVISLQSITLKANYEIK